ncbi:MAG: aminotransferase class III-fold pyridoxal phosphate-dependent enzyme [Elusimicrobiota bacterium]|jgi:glutamate-1-semialdehyde aminotransferase
MSQKLKLVRSEKLYKESQELIPGGMMGIRRPYNFVPGEYPIFFESGQGGWVIDADGNKFMDMLCAYGPIIIGHREKEIDDAVIKQIQEKGFCMSLVQEVQNELARTMRRLIPSCEKCVFVKTGSDATTTAIRVARAFTDRVKVLRCGYHGWHDWCVEVKGGIAAKFYEDVTEFHYNDLAQVEDIMKKQGSEVAAIIVTPVGHPLAHEVEMPKPGYLEGLKALAEKHGSVLIFDEIRSGFRVNMGGAQKEFKVTPHMSVFGKAMANGYEISAVVGRADILDMLVQKAFLSSTFFPNSLAQVAALATIKMLERDHVLDVIRQRGAAFAKKVSAICAGSGIACNLSGAPWMPYITFERDDKNLYKKLRPEFYTQLIRRGVFLQPFHHGYIAYRHTEKDLDFAAAMIAEAFEETKKNIIK